jgi:alkanesulfonate monooxygenase SsuD/methylene tetrahydromethanopterin reductase-like flavin-dependent oxidoreductase (luciferase family)
MKHTLLLTVLSIGFLASCSTAFKAGQTPDDVYYSPGREITSAKQEEKDQRQKEEYQEYVSSQDDRYLRMKVANRNRWSSLDDFDYWHDSRYDFCSCNCYNSLYLQYVEPRLEPRALVMA